MAAVRASPKSIQRERYSSAASSGGDNVQSTGQLQIIEDVDVMQVAQKIVESVTLFSPFSISFSRLTKCIRPQGVVK